MSKTTKARAIIAKLVERPDLFAEVARIIKDEYEFASPWTQDAGDHWVRTDLTGQEYVAQVGVLDDGQYGWWADTEMGRGVAASEVKAKAAVDKLLREAGITLPMFDKP